MCCAQQRDEGKKQRAVEPVLVELVRLDIRGRDHHDARLEQAREQAAEDHRVGDIGDVKFVKAQQPGFLGERGRGLRDRVAVGKLAGFDLLAIDVHALVHVGHEFMEVDAALALHRARGEEQIHQHGLAAADVAVNVETLDRSLRLVLGEQPAKLG